jgi:hypothetical protein
MLFMPYGTPRAILPYLTVEATTGDVFVKSYTAYLLPKLPTNSNPLRIWNRKNIFGIYLPTTKTI